MIRAAGILFLTPQNTVLFLKRAGGGDHVGEWCLPGGKIEGDETAEQAALREAHEECGFSPEKGSNLLYLTRQVRMAVDEVESSVDFTTFVMHVPGEFAVTTDDESAGYAWAPLIDPPRPLHPGCEISLARMGMDELGVAKAIATDQLTSPQKYENVWLFDIRVSGTGAAYRSKAEEFVWRDPDLYLNQEFLERCNGLSVIWEHPEGNTLDSKEFQNRVIGSIFLPHIRGQEVWGVAKIYDEEAVSMMEKEQWSTSPAVLFGVNTNTKLKLESGATLLVEGKPVLLDHVAVCARGVWDKGGAPTGVLTQLEAVGDSAMTEAEKKEAEEKAAADKARKDAEEKEKADRAKADAEAGEKLDKILSCLDSMGKRMDSQEARLDSMEGKANELVADKSRKDASEEEKEKEKMAADKAKKDADEKEEKEKADRARKDSDIDVILRAISDVTQRQERIEKTMPKPMTAADHAETAEIQARADSVFMLFGERAPGPLDCETPSAYRRRLLEKQKKHSGVWKDVDLSKLPDEVVTNVVERQVYADAEVASRNPTGEDGSPILREIRRTDQSGRVISEFVGSPDWVNPHKSQRQYFTGLSRDVMH